MTDWHFWSRFSAYDNTVDRDTLRRLMQYNFVSHSVSSGHTQRDVVEQMAQHAQTPISIDSLADRLTAQRLIRGQTIFESLGSAVDSIALNYPDMHWWLTENGLKMEITKPLHVRLAERLDEEVGDLSPQARGYAFEDFLDAMFAVSGLSPRKSFRLTGEQIDGSFQLDDTTYIMEAKWQDSPIGSHELYAFAGVVKSKASWSRGLFISYSGFSSDGLTAFERGEKAIIGLSGDELRYILAHNVDLASALRLKARHAAETGEVFMPLQDLLRRQ